MRRLLLAGLVTVGLTAGLSSSAQAISSAQACHASSSPSFSATEHSYNGNPLRSTPYNQMIWITNAWGSAGYPYGTGWDDAGWTTESNCIVKYERGSSIGVNWYVDIEMHLQGTGTYATDFWVTGRRCYGVNAATHALVAPPPSDCNFGDATDLRDTLDP